ncbi:hypothetical protein ACFL5E_01605 [Candidatus Omnitrophota bacterium]
MSKYSSNIAVDARNRLILTETTQDKVPVTGYEVSTYATGGKKRLKKIAVDGTWSLTPELDLKFRVSGSKTPLRGKTIILRGDVGRTKGSSLTFNVRAYEGISGVRTTSLTLSGKWLADGNNRITFKVTKGRGRYDTLRFQGAWQVNRRNELIYRYEKTALKTKTKRAKILIFRGRWELGKRYLVYNFEGSGDSCFTFKAALQSRSLMASDGVVKYQIGIKYYIGKRLRKRTQVVTIFGVWKLGKDLKIAFEAACSGGRHSTMRFSVEKLIGEGNSITVALKKEDGESLGFEVTFRKVFRDDAELFLAISRFAEESRIIGGVRIRF